MKAVITSFVLVFATAPFVFAQSESQTAPPPGSAPGSMSAPAESNPMNVAVQNAIHYQADQIEARRKIDQAHAAEQRKDLPTAAQLYDDAWGLADEVGPSAQAEREMAAAGVASVRMQLAMEAQHHGDYNEADRQVSDILRVSPGNTMAQQFKMANDRLIEASRGTRPSRNALEAAKAVHEESIQTAQLVQDGKLMWQLGKIDEAEIKLKEALNRDPSNQAALYYLSLCKQADDRRVEDARNITSMDRMVQVERGWADNDARKALPVPNLYARTNMIYTSKGKQKIFEKLNSIVFDKISFPGLQLSEVIRNLTEQTQRRDIDQVGINFLLDREKPAPATPLPGTPGAVGAIGAPQPTFDPTTGQPIPVQPTTTEDVDLGSVTISLDPGLKNVRLADVLEAIVASADHPIKYSILDYGISFSLKGPDTPELHTRTFRVDPNTFYMGLQNVSTLSFGAVATGGGGGGGGGGAGGQSIGATTIPRVDVTGNGFQSAGGAGGGGGGQQAQPLNIAGAAGQGGAAGTAGAIRGLRYVTGLDPTVEIQLAVINFFNAVGVNLAPPKSVFFNDRQGTLTVRATSDDLDLIEQAIETLNIAPPEVTVKTRFVEVNQNDSKALGFDWYLGNFLMGGNKLVGSAGSQPTFTGNPSLPANSGGSFPGDPNFGTSILPQTSDSLLTGGLRNSVNNVNVPAVATLTGILTDPQFRVVLHALEQRDGADLLNEGEVTTLSGRQASFQVADIQTIVTGAPANSTGGTATPAGGIGGGNVIQNQGAAINYTLQSSPYGTTLDVVPYVCADGYTIQMTLIPTVTEFVGYDNPGNFIPTIVTGSGGIPLTGQLPLPRSRVRQVVTSCIVWDGQTVVLGGLITESVQRQKDKVPLLGDLPAVGRLFRSEANFTQKKNLIVFVTPTIIDPSGNRRNLDSEMPFAATSIPPQPPQ